MPSVWTLASFEEQLFLNSSQEFLSELWVLSKNSTIPLKQRRREQFSPPDPLAYMPTSIHKSSFIFPVTNCNQLEYHTLLSPWKRWETTCLYFAKYSTYRYFQQEYGISIQEIPLNSQNPLWVSLRRRKSNNIYLSIEQCQIK